MDWAPVLVVRMIEALVLCLVVLLLLWSSLATPPVPVAVLEALVVVVLWPPVVPVPVLLLPLAPLRAPQRSWRTPVEIVVVLPALLAAVREFALAFVARKMCVAASVAVTGARCSAGHWMLLSRRLLGVVPFDLVLSVLVLRRPKADVSVCGCSCVLACCCWRSCPVFVLSCSAAAAPPPGCGPWSMSNCESAKRTF
jgi:hypothetical protein